MNFKNFLSVILCATLAAVTGTQAKGSGMPELSAQEQEQLIQQQVVIDQMSRELGADFTLNLLKNNVEAIEWLWTHAAQQQKKAADLITALFRKYMSPQGRAILKQWARRLGVPSSEEKEFIEGMSQLFEQVMPMEFEKWLSLSIKAGLRLPSHS